MLDMDKMYFMRNSLFGSRMDCCFLIVSITKA